jgi:outer membrane protein TolC
MEDRKRVLRKSDVSDSRWCAALLRLSLVAGLLAPASYMQGQISLTTVVELAEKNSSAVKLSETDVRKAEAILQQTRDVYIPSFVIGSGIGPPSIGFTFSQPSVASATMQSLAFSFPQRQYIRAAQAGVEAANLSLKDAREQVALDASLAYVELDAVMREIASAHQQSEFSDRLMSIEQQRSEAGVDAMSEFLQARLTGAQLRLKLLHLETRAATLAAQLASLTGLPKASMVPDHASIPEVPAIEASDVHAVTLSVQSAQSAAESREFQARGDEISTKIRPQVGFGAQYNRDATSLNNYNQYFGRIDPKTGQTVRFKADNFSAGFSIQIPLFDLNHRAKARQSAAEALRATAEAEQAQRQNEVEIATLTESLRELDAVAEVASLKQQIAAEQVKTVQTELATGNGAGPEPGGQPQLSPKSEQLARIDERQKFIESIDAGFELSKARLSLLRALNHMGDWLSELHGKNQGTVTSQGPQ